MFSNDDTTRALELIGIRLRDARVAKGDSQELFAKRLSVSIPTLREMERGSPAVAIGTWFAALWMLSRLDEIDTVLVTRESMFDQIKRDANVRRRAPRRGRLP